MKAAVAEVVRRELRAHAPQEVDELRALQAALDVELLELEDVRAAVSVLASTTPASRAGTCAPGTAAGAGA